MRRLLRAAGTSTRPGSRVLTDLIYGWGNESWSAPDEYLDDCINHALTSTGPILECGSGLSTIVVGAIAKRRRQEHWALEHMPDWTSKVQRHLDRYKLDTVILCSTPLKDYGDFCWYDVPLRSMPDNFALVICDGPPGGTKGGRYGLVPIMKDRLAPGCVILLDDAVREQELVIAGRWQTEIGAARETLGARKPYFKITVTSGQFQPLHNAPSSLR
jgi:hypothetical protein